MSVLYMVGGAAAVAGIAAAIDIAYQSGLRKGFNAGLTEASAKPIGALPEKTDGMAPGEAKADPNAKVTVVTHDGIIDPVNVAPLKLMR